MKLGPVLLLNLLTVAIALVVYDQVRSEPVKDRGAPTRGGGSASLERRVLELETRSPQTNDAVLERLGRLESSMNRSQVPMVEAKPIERATAMPQEPTEDEVDRFIRLRDAAHERDRVKRNWARVEKALGKISVSLTRRQREQVHTAYARFQPRVNQIWGAAKDQARETIESGGEIDKEEFVTSTTARIQQEFAGTLHGIVRHQGDAEAIAAALMPIPGGK
ncbi:MAG: hypothetical protein ACYTHK_14215 [Planctomycetota bacterium]|jgi:hypothetical protein